MGTKLVFDLHRRGGFTSRDSHLTSHLGNVLDFFVGMSEPHYVFCFLFLVQLPIERWTNRQAIAMWSFVFPPPKKFLFFSGCTPVLSSQL